jgi:hypothetical protein
MTQPTSRIAGCVSPGARRPAIARLAAWIVCSALLLACGTSGPSPTTNFESYEEIKRQARSLGCVENHEPSAEEFHCAIFVGPCSCRIQLDLFRRNVFVDAYVRECPSGEAGGASRLKAATLALTMLEPLLTPDDGDRGRYEAIRDLLASDLPPRSGFAQDAVTRTIDGLRLGSVLHQRFADVSAELEWSTDTLEDRDDDGRVRAAFGLGTTTVHVRLNRYYETKLLSDSVIHLGYSEPLCRDGTLRPWQVYAFAKRWPPNVTSSVPVHPEGWTPRTAAVVWAELASRVEQMRGQQPRPIADVLHQAVVELREIVKRALDPDVAQSEARDAGTDAVVEVEKMLDLWFKFGVHERLDMRESGLEELFARESELLEWLGERPFLRSRSYFDATQPKTVLSGSR